MRRAECSTEPMFIFCSIQGVQSIGRLRLRYAPPLDLKPFVGRPLIFLARETADDHRHDAGVHRPSKVS